MIPNVEEVKEKMTLYRTPGTCGCIETLPAQFDQSGLARVPGSLLFGTQSGV